MFHLNNKVLCSRFIWKRNDASPWLWNQRLTRGTKYVESILKLGSALSALDGHSEVHHWRLYVVS